MISDKIKVPYENLRETPEHQRSARKRQSRTPIDQWWWKILLLLIILYPSYIPSLASGQKSDTPITPHHSASNNFGYTNEHPLIIVSDWDFRPFEFLDSEGHPSGYNIDVLNLILNKLNIPHKFYMEEWHLASAMFQRHDADLIHALYSFYHDAPYVTTHKFINYYNVKVARRADMPQLNRLSTLQNKDTLILKEDDYAAIVIANKDNLAFATEYQSPKNGLTGIRSGRYKYFIWGEIPLNRKIQELGLDSIVLDDIDIPAGELRIIGYNKDLVDLIDDEYTRLEQAGELQKIYDRWFRPELKHDDVSPLVLFIVGGLFLSAIIVYLLTRLVRRRVNKAVQENSHTWQMMDQVLNMGDYFMLEWDLKSNMLHNKYGNMLPHGNMKPEEFLKRMPPKEAEHLHALNMQMITGAISHFDISISFNQGEMDAPKWRHFYGNGIVEKEHGKPLYIVFTIKDITDEVIENQRIKTLANKYKQLFDTNLIATSFYDANGNLIDLNKKMYELCQIDKNNEQYFRRNILFNFPNLKGIYMPGSREIFYVCQRLYEPQIGIDKYIEFHIIPVINKENELVYYIVTTRDITAERNMYIEQREHDKRLHAINKAIERYEKQLGYLLEESQTYMWTFRPTENHINMTRSPGKIEFSETLEGYLQTISPQVRQQAKTLLEDAMQQRIPYNTILPFEYTPLDNHPSWYSISGMPIFNKEGQLTEYFGLSRNITSLMNAQEQLRIETARAEDSGRIKAAFLANMSHEIRTPLNAIVGFSDLLPVVETDKERMDFIRTIRNNCDLLLRLINDILEASDMTAGTITITPEEVDFAQVFNDICQTLEQRVQEGNGRSVVQFIKDNPYEKFVTILDKGRMQQVITNFVTNATKYTQEGHIKVGYRYQDGGIYMYCEDTGAGIPKDKQASVFERFVKLNDFVQGTGLGLSICKTIAEQTGGKIGVDSEGEGQGSTFWIWIPCEVISEKN